MSAEIGTARGGFACVMCGKPLRGSRVYAYPHGAGAEIGGAKMWVYVECRHCGYQNSFRKLRAAPEEILGIEAKTP